MHYAERELFRYTKGCVARLVSKASAESLYKRAGESLLTHKASAAKLGFINGKYDCPHFCVLFSKSAAEIFA